jgi:hypothetical protein
VGSIDAPGWLTRCDIIGAANAMRRLLMSWAASLILGLGLAIPPAFAQQGRSADPASAETNERSASPLAYAMAFFMTVPIMLILCMPTRKRQAG